MVQLVHQPQAFLAGIAALLQNGRFEIVRILTGKVGIGQEHIIVTGPKIIVRIVFGNRHAQSVITHGEIFPTERMLFEHHGVEVALFRRVLEHDRKHLQAFLRGKGADADKLVPAFAGFQKAAAAFQAQGHVAGFLFGVEVLKAPFMQGDDPLEHGGGHFGRKHAFFPKRCAGNLGGDLRKVDIRSMNVGRPVQLTAEPSHDEGRVIGGRLLK